MEEEIIRITIDENLKELKNTDDFEGLCYYFSNNIMCDLLEQDIDTKMVNIKDCTDVNYDHYFLIADDKYLIDVTYSQFLPNKGTVRFFKDFPANILAQSEEGQVILNELINNYYVKLKDDYLNTYLSSFQSKEKKR